MISVVNWFEIQLIWLSIDLRFKWFWLSIDLRFNWFGCHLIWDSNDFGCQLIWDSIDLIVNCFEIQMIWLSIDVCFKRFWLSVGLNFKWCGCQSIWDSSDSVVNWSEIQVIWLSIDLRFKWFWLSTDLRFNWFGCHLIWDSNDFGCQLIWDSIDLIVNWFEIQMIWLSIDVCFKWFWLSVGLNFKWCGCQSIWDSSDSVVNWSEIQVIWLSIDLRFKWVGCQLIWDSSDSDVKWFEVQVIWLSTDVWFKWFCRTKLFCETSFKNEALKLKNEAFVRDFLQKRSFEDQKRSFCARLPSKMKLWSSKTQLLCETSFKNEASNIKNEAFLRDFLQKWSFEAQKRCFCARLPSKMKLRTSKTKHFCETSFKNDMLTARLTSELQYVLAIFKWMLQKYCACHEKVEPRHTKSCDCHAKWSLQSKTSVTWNLQPFHGFCVEGLNHRHRKARNPCPCHAKRIVSEPLQIHHACQRFCNPHELVRLPRILKRIESLRLPREKHFEHQKVVRDPGVLTILSSKSFSRAGVVQIFGTSTSKSAPNLSVFNDFDFQIVLARRRGANFCDFNFQKCSRTVSF